MMAQISLTLKSRLWMYRAIGLYLVIIGGKAYNYIRSSCISNPSDIRIAVPAQDFRRACFGPPARE